MKAFVVFALVAILGCQRTPESRVVSFSRYDEHQMAAPPSCFRWLRHRKCPDSRYAVVKDRTGWTLMRYCFQGDLGVGCALEWRKHHAD